MTISSTVIKKTAKTALTNEWVRSIAASVLFLSANLILFLSMGQIGTVFPEQGVFLTVQFLLSFFLGFPLFMGVLGFFWRILWGQTDRLTVCFRFFADRRQYFRVLKTALFVLLNCVKIGIIAFAPAIILDIFSGETVYTLLGMDKPMWISNLWMVSRILKAAALVIVVLISVRYYAVPFFLLADEEMEPLEVLYFSRKISAETWTEFIWLIFSFAPVLLLSLFVVPMIFTLPYLLTSYLVHCRFATAQYNRGQKGKAENTMAWMR